MCLREGSVDVTGLAVSTTYFPLYACTSGVYKAWQCRYQAYKVAAAVWMLILLGSMVGWVDIAPAPDISRMGVLRILVCRSVLYSFSILCEYS